MRLVKRIERVKELLLSPLLASDKLDIVEDKNIDISEFLLELVHFVPSQGPDQLIHK